MNIKSLLLFSFLLMPFCAWAAPITVRVIDEAGAPVEGATVQINRADSDLQTYALQTTDAQGVVKYELGASKFNADLFGRAAVWKAGNALTGGVLYQLADGSLTLKLRAGASVSGIVEGANGPIEGALITLDSAQGNGSYLQLDALSPLALKLGVRSDAQGRWKIENMPAKARLEFRVAAQGYATQEVLAPSGGGDVKAQLRAGAGLRGKVIGIDGAALAGLDVVALSQRDKYGATPTQATTDAAGHYSLSGLEAGVYNVMFRAPSADFVVAAREGALAVAGEVRDLETARAVAGVWVRARVVDSVSKAGIAGIAGSVFGPTQPASSGPVGGFATDKDGYFSVRLAPGTNTISISKAPAQWEKTDRKIAFEVAENGAAPQPIVELTRAVALRGRLVDEAGNGVKTPLSVKQDYREWPLQPDENGEFSVYPDFKGKVSFGAPSFVPNRDDETQTPWEVAEPKTYVLPSTEPIQIVMKRAQIGDLSGTAEDETGAPLAGVKLKLTLTTDVGLSSRGQFKETASNAQGRFELPNIRSSETVKLRGIEKTGYDLQSGGEITKNGNDWKLAPVIMRARRNQLSGRVTLADGKGAANALVFAAGRETRADQNGAYVLKVLPAGNADIFVYGAGQFGFRSAQTVGAGDAATATDIKLAPQPLQPTDRELAGEIWARARVLAAQSKPDEIGRLKLSEPDPVGALEALVAAPNNPDRMAMAIYRGANNPDVSTDLLLRAVRAVGDARWRLYAAAILFSKRPDWPDDDATRDLVTALARDADALAADKTEANKWLGAIDLIGIAPIIEKYDGPEAGQKAMARGIAWTKSAYPQPGDGNLNGYLSMLAAGAESIAQTSPPLFAQLLEAVDDQTSPAYSRALQQGLVAIARARGLEAAAPFLRQLSEMPVPDQDVPGGGTNYAARQATRQAIEAGGAKNPDLALQLARGLGADSDNLENENARALAEAAFFQPPAVAASLWREAFEQLNADRAASIAARVTKTQPALGAELWELARQKIEAWRAVNSWGNSMVATFAYYEAQSDAARARYRLEKAWVQAQSQTDDFQFQPDLVRAMAAIDGERAFEWASLLPADGINGDQRIDALSQVARYIEASERARARVDFEVWKRDSTVFME